MNLILAFACNFEDYITGRDIPSERNPQRQEISYCNTQTRVVILLQVRALLNPIVYRNCWKVVKTKHYFVPINLFRQTENHIKNINNPAVFLITNNINIYPWCTAYPRSESAVKLS